MAAVVTKAKGSYGKLTARTKEAEEFQGHFYGSLAVGAFLCPAPKLSGYQFVFAGSTDEGSVRNRDNNLPLTGGTAQRPASELAVERQTGITFRTLA